MGTPTYTALANITLGSSAASVTFSSISQAYRDLVLVCQTKSGAADNQSVRLRFNSDSGANYSWTDMTGDGTNAFANGAASINYFRTDLSAYSDSTGSFLITRVDLFDYSATDKHKTGLVRNDAALYATDTLASRWASTSPITSISVIASITKFGIGSTFSLYGIAA